MKWKNFLKEVVIAALERILSRMKKDSGSDKEKVK